MRPCLLLLFLLLCCGTGCVSVDLEKGNVDILFLSDEIRNGIDLRKMAKRFGPPDIIDFKANRVGYRAEYSITERDHLSGIFGGESKETFKETWHLILDTEVPKARLMPVELYWNHDKTDLPDDDEHFIPSHVYSSYGEVKGHGRRASWAKWREHKGFYRRNNGIKGKGISGLSSPPRDEFGHEKKE